LSGLEPVLSAGPLPRHIAIIMDGNGRWAERRGLVRLEGHRKGSDSVRTVVTTAREVGVEALTLYAFSAQNWGRPPEEVAGLIALLYDYLDRERPTILNNDIRLRGIGEIDRFPDFVQERLHALEQDSAHCRSMVLTLALSYGGREEIIRAARALAADAVAGRLAPEEIDEGHIERLMFTHDLPPVDLVIRTSGEMRLSNFLLWQVAYAEIVVTEVLWPDFGKADLFASIEAFRRRERRFGLTGKQVATAPE
jgi:undecaprenyl diphosphate synthase